MPIWTEVDLEYEPSDEKSQPFKATGASFRADTLGRKEKYIDTPRQRYFEAQLQRLAEALETTVLPIFVSWRGQRLRMDKGCIGHAVARKFLNEPEDDPIADYVTHVCLMSSHTPAIPMPLQSASKPSRVWLTTFWAFTPIEEGYLGFAHTGDRERLIREYEPGDLVLIFGTSSPQTKKEDRRRVLGFLEIEPVRVTERERSSEAGRARKVAMGIENRWSYAVPARRAWRVEGRIDVRQIATETYTHARAMTIATRGVLLTESEAIKALQLRVVPMNVFGEPPVEIGVVVEATMANAFSPSRGITPTFGDRVSQYEDGDNFLYMLSFDGDAACLLGRDRYGVGVRIIVKVGYSNNPKQRCEDHNSMLPPAAKTRWRLSLTSRAFPDGARAKAAEDTMKEQFASRFESLGGEFFLGLSSDLESAFVRAAEPAAFVLSAESKTV